MADLRVRKITTPAAPVAQIVVAAVTAVLIAVIRIVANQLTGNENTSTNTRRATKVGKKRKVAQKAASINVTRSTATSVLMVNLFGL